MERETLDRDVLDADSALESALEDERSRLADLLHDGPLSSLIAARQDLLELGDPAVADVAAQLADVLAELRTLTRGYHADRLSDLPLRTAVRDLARIAAEAGSAGVDLDLDDCELLRPHAGLVRSAVLELTTNAVRHARPATIRVRTARSGPRTMELVVADDGPGIDPERAARRAGDGHLGLSRLRSRVQRVGGDVSIATGPTGTRVAVRLPIPDGEDAAPRRPTAWNDTLLSLAADPWMIVRDDASYVHVSDGMCRLLGYDREEILAAPVQDRPWFPDTARATAGRAAIVARTLSIGHHTADLRIVHRSGRTVRVLATSHLLPDRAPDGSQAFFALFRDVTDLIPGPG